MFSKTEKNLRPDLFFFNFISFSRHMKIWSQFHHYNSHCKEVFYVCAASGYSDDAFLEASRVSTAPVDTWCLFSQQTNQVLQSHYQQDQQNPHNKIRYKSILWASREIKSLWDLFWKVARRSRKWREQSHSHLTPKLENCKWNDIDDNHEQIGEATRIYTEEVVELT